MSLEFNREYLNSSYKLIWEDCMCDCLTIPYLIKENTDRENYPSSADRKKISKKLTKDQHKKLTEAYYNRRLKEHDLYKKTESESKRLNLIKEYKENEVKQFLKEYPKYNKLLL